MLSNSIKWLKFSQCFWGTCFWHDICGYIIYSIKYENTGPACFPGNYLSRGVVPSQWEGLLITLHVGWPELGLESPSHCLTSLLPQWGRKKREEGGWEWRGKGNTGSQRTCKNHKTLTVEWTILLWRGKQEGQWTPGSPGPCPGIPTGLQIPAEREGSGSSNLVLPYTSAHTFPSHTAFSNPQRQTMAYTSHIITI